MANIISSMTARKWWKNDVV